VRLYARRVTGSEIDLAGLRRRVAELERRLDHLYSRTGVEAPPPPGPGDVSPRVRELLAAGNTIGAIKQYRDETGAGLREGKERIDALLAGEGGPTLYT
jgi:hypothetical protein